MAGKIVRVGVGGDARQNCRSRLTRAGIGLRDALAGGG
jgi:hypothetical protein